MKYPPSVIVSETILAQGALRAFTSERFSFQLEESLQGACDSGRVRTWLQFYNRCQKVLFLQNFS